MVVLALPGELAALRRRGPAFSCLAGLVVSALVVMYIDHPAASSVAGLLAAVSGILSAVRYFAFRKKDFLAFLALGLAVGLALGGIQSHLSRQERAASYSALPLSTIGRVRLVLTGDSVVTKTGSRLYPGNLLAAATALGDREAAAQGTVVAFVPDGPALYWGQIVEIDGSLRPSTDPGGARYTVTARGRGVIERGWSSPLLSARRTALGAILSRVAALGAPASALFEALFLGVKDNLEFELRDAFARTGSLHLLALSGFNVGMVAALFLFFLSPLRSKRTKAVIAAVMVGVYFFLAGPEPSLLRAVLMLALGTIGLLLDREVDPLHVLFASAVIVLVVAPESVRSLSFQLSYLSLFGILTFGRRLNDKLIPWLPAFIRGLISAALAAQLFTAPVVLAAYGVVYPIGLAVSLLLVPLTMVYIWSGAGFLVLGLIPWRPVNELIRLLMDLQYKLIFIISDFFKRAPGLTLDWRDWFWLPAFLVWLALFLGFPVQRRHELRLAD